MASVYKTYVFVIGTRPEAIKQAPLILEARRLRDAGAGLNVVVLSTGQHREMLRPILRLFDIEPDIDLDLMEPNQTLEKLTAKAVVEIGAALADFPSSETIVFVQGDTTTAMAAALASFYKGISVCHVEAGLRTDNPTNPFPEEMNRRIIGQLATIHAPPTQSAAENLLRDYVVPAINDESTNQVAGNTVIDALKIALDRIEENPPASETLERIRSWKISRKDAKLILVTGHRRENFGDGFDSVFRALARIAGEHPEALLVYPVHLNPNVKGPAEKALGEIKNLLLRPPAEYPEFVALMKQADLIITDSGGVQEEAPFLGVPVLVTRTTTERPEALARGVVELVGTDEEKLVSRAKELLSRSDKQRQLVSPYGDGRAAERILALVRGQPMAPFEWLPDA